MAQAETLVKRNKKCYTTRNPKDHTTVIDWIKQANETGSTANFDFFLNQFQKDNPRKYREYKVEHDASIAEQT